MILYSIFVPGEPKGQPRPRAFAFHGKARVYDPGTAEHWKSQIATACPGFTSTIAYPVYVDLTFWMPRPKAHFNKHGLKADAPWKYAKKPDADNLAKAVLDALTTLGVWQDDAQVYALFVVKQYASADNKTGCLILIRDTDATRRGTQ